MKVLFQGDSITDAGRDYADPHHLGDGYPKYAAEAIRERFPDETFEFINLGISGNRTTDLLEPVAEGLHRGAARRALDSHRHQRHLAAVRLQPPHDGGGVRGQLPPAGARM